MYSFIHLLLLFLCVASFVGTLLIVASVYMTRCPKGQVDSEIDKVAPGTTKLESCMLKNGTQTGDQAPYYMSRPTLAYIGLGLNYAFIILLPILNHFIKPNLPAGLCFLISFFLIVTNVTTSVSVFKGIMIIHDTVWTQTVLCLIAFIQCFGLFLVFINLLNPDKAFSAPLTQKSGSEIEMEK